VAEGACLENMFGSHQRGFESHSLRWELMIADFCSSQNHQSQISNHQFTRGGARVAEWARLLSECRGNPVAGSNPALPATTKDASLRTRFLIHLPGSHGLLTTKTQSHEGTKKKTW
jgi:hypothetical protein